MGEERGVYAVKDKAGLSHSYRRLNEWADKWRWLERAGAYDRFIDRKRVRAHIEEVEAMARRQVQMGQLLQGHGTDWMIEQLDTPEKRAKELNANTALRFIDKGVDLEREGLGMNKDESAGDTNVTINVLDSGTQSDVFDTIDQMAANMVEVKALMQERTTHITIDAEDDAEDAELADDEAE